MLRTWRLTGALGALICVPSALAVDATGWCGSVAGSPVIACDDFDDYCADPPCDDGIGDDTPDQAGLLVVWPSDGCMSAPDALGQQVPSDAVLADDANCGEPVRTWDPVALCWEVVSAASSPCEVSAPLALKQNVGAYYPDAKSNQYVFDGTSHNHDLRPRIRQLDPAMGSVNGTDENPLVLQFVLGLPGDSIARFDAAQANRYVELTDGSDRAAAAVEITVCGLEEIPPNPKYRPQIAYPAGMDGLDHSAIAVGAFSVLEQGGVCSSEPLATLYRLAVYNGERWYEMKGNLPTAGNAEMKTAGGLNYMTMTVKTSVIEVTLDNTWDQDDDGTGCDDADGLGEPFSGTSVIPRVYTGSFARMHIGNGACLPSRKKDYVDNVAVTGGVLEPTISTGACCLIEGGCLEDTTQAGCENEYGGLYAGDGVTCEAANCPVPTGACCLPAGVCDETLDQSQCLAAGGVFNGPFSLCAEAPPCCPDPFADADGDQDVDHSDFGMFQLCFTGVGGGVLSGCSCFNTDGDTDVDEDDLAAFELCATGPGIPADIQCD